MCRQWSPVVQLGSHAGTGVEITLRVELDVSLAKVALGLEVLPRNAWHLDAGGVGDGFERVLPKGLVFVANGLILGRPV